MNALKENNSVQSTDTTLKYRAPAALAALSLPLLGHFVLERFGVPHGQAEMIASSSLLLSPALLAREIKNSCTRLIGNSRDRLGAILNKGSHD